MTAPQITLIVLFSINLLLSARDHGKEKEGKDNFWTTLLALAIVLSILIWGGFFK